MIKILLDIMRTLGGMGGIANLQKAVAIVTQIADLFRQLLALGQNPGLAVDGTLNMTAAPELDKAGKDLVKLLEDNGASPTQAETVVATLALVDEAG